MKQNNDIITKHLHHNIVFGESIMLQHVKSKKYLCVTSNTQSSEITQSYILKMKSVPDQNCIFKLHSYYKYQEEMTKFIEEGCAVQISCTIERRNCYI